MRTKPKNPSRTTTTKKDPEAELKSFLDLLKRSHEKGALIEFESLPEDSIPKELVHLKKKGEKTRTKSK